MNTHQCQCTSKLGLFTLHLTCEYSFLSGLPYIFLHMVVYIVVSPSVFEALAMQQTECPSDTFVPHTAIAASVHELSA